MAWELGRRGDVDLVIGPTIVPGKLPFPWEAWLWLEPGSGISLVQGFRFLASGPKVREPLAGLPAKGISGTVPLFGQLGGVQVGTGHSGHSPLIWSPEDELGFRGPTPNWLPGRLAPWFGGQKAGAPGSWQHLKGLHTFPGGKGLWGPLGPKGRLKGIWAFRENRGGFNWWLYHGKHRGGTP